MERLLSAQEVAEVFAMDQATVRRMAKQKLLPAIRIGHLWRFKPSALRALLGEESSGETSGSVTE